MTRKLITSHVDDTQRAIIGEWWTEEIVTNQYVPDDAVIIVDVDALDEIMMTPWEFE